MSDFAGTPVRLLLLDGVRRARSMRNLLLDGSAKGFSREGYPDARFKEALLAEEAEDDLGRLEAYLKALPDDDHRLVELAQVLQEDAVEAERAGIRPPTVRALIEIMLWRSALTLRREGGDCGAFVAQLPQEGVGKLGSGAGQAHRAPLAPPLQRSAARPGRIPRISCTELVMRAQMVPPE